MVCHSLSLPPAVLPVNFEHCRTILFHAHGCRPAGMGGESIYGVKFPVRMQPIPEQLHCAYLSNSKQIMMMLRTHATSQPCCICAG